MVKGVNIGKRNVKKNCDNLVAILATNSHLVSEYCDEMALVSKILRQNDRWPQKIATKLHLVATFATKH